MSTDSRMPVVFFGHGSPINVLENNEATKAWAQIAKSIGKPKAILCVSAHWYIKGTAVTAMAQPRTIHDFGRSLPAPLFDIQYPAPGDPQLALRVCDLLAPITVTQDHSWGLDHGTWAVLAKAYPDAGVPVVQLSIDYTKPGAWHFEVGQRLQALRDEGVLVIASGNIVHNLGVMEWSPTAQPYDWAIRFNDFVKDKISNNSPESLFDMDVLGRDAVNSINGPEHYLPLLYALGARRDDDKVHFESDFIAFKSLSMTSIVFGG